MLCSCATIFGGCKNDEAPIIPDETVIGTQGEILGVSYYTVENEPETHSIVFEITTKKQKKSDNKTTNIPDKTANKSTVKSATTPDKNEAEKNTVIGSVKTTEKKSETQKTANSTTRKSKVTQAGHIPIPYVKPTDKPTKKAQPTTVRQTQAATKQSPVSGNTVTVKDESKGISVVFKNETVLKGDTASIMIQGTPGKKYSMKFYTGSSEDSAIDSFEEMTADENGFITWTFHVPMNSETGNRKIIISENKSDNFIQTSINVE